MYGAAVGVPQKLRSTIGTFAAKDHSSSFNKVQSFWPRSLTAKQSKKTPSKAHSGGLLLGARHRSGVAASGAIEILQDVSCHRALSLGV